MSKIAFLLADQFEDSEMQVPYDELKKAGHEADIIGLKQGEKVNGKQGKASYTIEKAIGDVESSDYDAVVIPGGSSPENLRLDAYVLKFVTEINEAKKTITAYPPLKDDLINAGAHFEDREAVVDGNFITSRTPKDEPAFVRELLKVL
ncbi:DJ-1/PfpI family protein [Paenibacillus maysiensis]|uniref:DJ-1/PfpI family protein n=1 Tax=Paenibacillus maysiensis TaxID=1155954 RepID=UPI0004712ADD|nr:DJ-1/PfpI family protein [Paenibacillus maysiensis]